MAPAMKEPINSVVNIHLFGGYIFFKCNMKRLLQSLVENYLRHEHRESARENEVIYYKSVHGSMVYTELALKQQQFQVAPAM